MNAHVDTIVVRELEKGYNAYEKVCNILKKVNDDFKMGYHGDFPQTSLLVEAFANVFPQEFIACHGYTLLVGLREKPQRGEALSENEGGKPYALFNLSEERSEPMPVSVKVIPHSWLLYKDGYRKEVMDIVPLGTRAGYSVPVHYPVSVDAPRYNADAQYFSRTGKVPHDYEVTYFARYLKRVMID